MANITNYALCVVDGFTVLTFQFNLQLVWFAWFCFSWV